uniref:Uncharacterized protein n=1 Tax=Anguilla anguilla TaxID=7936 RepID=A0A0E9R0J1_ANGAN
MAELLQLSHLNRVRGPRFNLKFQLITRCLKSNGVGNSGPGVAFPPVTLSK